MKITTINRNWYIQLIRALILYGFFALFIGYILLLAGDSITSGMISRVIHLSNFIPVIILLGICSLMIPKGAIEFHVEQTGFFRSVVALASIIVAFSIVRHLQVSAFAYWLLFIVTCVSCWFFFNDLFTKPSDAQKT